MSKGWQLKDLTGCRFGKLLVIKRGKTTMRGKIKWVCQCDCGKIQEVHGGHLHRGESSSCGCSRKIDVGLAAQKLLFAYYKKSARRRGFCFNIDFDNFISMCQKPCCYCNKSPSKVIKPSSNGYFVYNGIDRVNNELGYVPGNCITCCTICNLMKLRLSQSQFLDHIKVIFNNFYGGNYR